MRDSQVTTSGRLRIIAGAWRGRRLAFPGTRGLRPTPDRVRETLFNWLQFDIHGSRCLDLFAGSGALGFESASRGASRVIMVERDAAAAAAIRNNIEILHASGVALVESNADDFLAREDGEFDIVFLDPPFNSNVLATCCGKLENSNRLSEHALIYVEHAAGVDFEPPPVWERLRRKCSGQVEYELYRRGC